MVPSVIAGAALSSRVLLVATDFDGTLSPLVEDHRLAGPAAGAIRALERLCAIPGTHVGVLSGRGLADLGSRLGSPGGWALFGSHGAESGDGPVAPIPAAMADRLRAIEKALRCLCGAVRGLAVETKPRGVALHYRGIGPGDEARVEASILRMVEEHPELRMLRGSRVVEFVVDPTTKADALRTLRLRVDATVVVFVGDDLTDEHAFRSLRPCDFGIKVGPGETAARFRLGSVDEVVRFLEELGSIRAARFRPVEAEAWSGGSTRRGGASG